MSKLFLLPPSPSSEETDREAVLPYKQELVFLPSRALHLDPEEGYSQAWPLPALTDGEYIQNIRLNSEDLFEHEGYLYYESTRLTALTPVQSRLFHDLADRREFFYTSLELNLGQPQSRQPHSTLSVEIPTCEIDSSEHHQNLAFRWQPLARECYHYTTAINPLQTFAILDRAASIIAKTRYYFMHMPNGTPQPVPKKFIVDIYCCMDTARYSDKRIADNDSLVLITLPLRYGELYTGGNQMSWKVDYNEKNPKKTTVVSSPVGGYPNWVGRNVTEDKRFAERYLHDRPFGNWRSNERKNCQYPRYFPTE